MTISEGINGGDDGVRERSPLHEVGERAWPGAGEDFSAAADSPDGVGGGSRAKFRLRVGRRGGPTGGSATQRGPLVRMRIFLPCIQYMSWRTAAKKMSSLHDPNGK
jgi:hypothetical protein